MVATPQVGQGDRSPSPLHATVVVRSMNRPQQLAELLRVLLDQDYPSFEVLIVDSSDRVSPDQLERMLHHPDPRVRSVRTPPRGCAAAANIAIREARGEVVVFVDDDDLPVGRGWLSAHMRCYHDPCCLGVNGYMEYDAAQRAAPTSSTDRRYRRMLTQGFFKNNWGYAYAERPKRGIDFLLGGNSSIRREAALRARGWDEFLRLHNELSLFLRLAKVRAPGEYLLYHPAPRMVIRPDVPGGLERRTDDSLWARVRARVDASARYYLWSVGPEHPGRIYGLLPVFVPFFVGWAAAEAVMGCAGMRHGRAVPAALGALYAPLALWRSARQPPARRHDWIGEPATE